MPRGAGPCWCLARVDETAPTVAVFAIVLVAATAAVVTPKCALASVLHLFLLLLLLLLLLLAPHELRPCG